MLSQFRKIINAQGFKQLDKVIYEPNVRLGVGEAEQKSALPTIVEYPNFYKEPLIPSLDHSSIDMATLEGSGEAVNEKDFPKNHYFGEAIGGF